MRYHGVYQAGSRPGSVGRPLPGVSVRIVDPETHEIRPDGEPGMILVRGPNVMRGYLGRGEITRQVMRGGWYVTGDVGYSDADGFVFITGRESRFSKTGGEMVPHEVSAVDGNVFAVTGVPDERKGERLVVFHTTSEESIPDLLKVLKRRGLPNLFIPRVEPFIRVDALPLLGSGKLDLRRLQEMALESHQSSTEGAVVVAGGGGR